MGSLAHHHFESTPDTARLIIHDNLMMTHDIYKYIVFSYSATDQTLILYYIALTIMYLKN